MLTWIKSLLLKRNVPSVVKKTKKKKPVSIFELMDRVYGMRTPGGRSYGDILKEAESRTFQRKITEVVKPTTYAMDGVTVDAAESTVIIPDVFSFQGQGLPAVQVAWFASWGFIGWQMCALLAQHWLIEKACKMPCEDAVRNGYELGSRDRKATPEMLDRLKILDSEYGLEESLIEFVYFGRVFGIRVMMFQVDMGDSQKQIEYYKNPFNIDAVKPGTYRGMVQIDPYWMSPELDFNAAANPHSMHFYEPTWWIISGLTVHRSHLMIMRNGMVADVLKPTYYYGGIPLPQKIANRVYAAERTADEAPLLALTKRSTNIHTDLKQALADPAAFGERMQQWAEWRDNLAIKVVGINETVEQMDTALSDMDALIMTQYQLVAAIAGVPAVKLLGTSPKGFGASGEYEENNYHEELKSIQAHKMSPVIRKHHQLVIRSEFPKEQWFTAEHTWNALDSTTSKGIAENNKLKSETGINLVNSGAISPEEERSRIAGDKNSGYAGLVKGDGSEQPEDEDGDETQEAA